jgi:hypothetical protein
MSYDLSLRDPVSGEELELDEPHFMRGGTYCVSGDRALALNITYNYYPCFWWSIGENGIRTIYGMSGAASIPVLQKAISLLGDDVDEDYWKPTQGNAKRALCQLVALAMMRPDGVWDGD